MRRIHRLLLLTIAGFLLSLSAPALSQQPVQGPALTQAQPSSAIDGVTVAPDAAGFQVFSGSLLGGGCGEDDLK
ncbi:MAG: hypothetical protein AAFN08_17845, partial [Cyanobacteria bacterium J06559_3]